MRPTENIATATPVAAPPTTTPAAATCVPTPRNRQPIVERTHGEMQREGGQPVQLVATRDGMVRCEVCGDMAPGSIVEIWAFSTPRLVGAAVVDERGCIDVMVPLSAPLDGGPAIAAGQHTLQVILPMDDGQGRLAVNVGVTVGLRPGSLPAGEGVPSGATPLGGMLSVALAGLVVALRRGPRRDAGLAQGTVGSA